MKIKMLVSLGTAGKCYAPDDIYECSADEARRHIEAGNAVPVAEKVIERAVKAPVEKRG